MNTTTRFWTHLLSAGMLAAVLGLSGCGDDGDTGPAGPAGPEGPAGPAGGDAALDAETIVALGLEDTVVPLNPVLDLSNTVSYDAATGALTVHFFLTDGVACCDDDVPPFTSFPVGAGVDVFSDAYEFRFYVSELIDNNDGTSGQSWNPLINRESGTPADPNEDQLPGTLTQIDAATGEYSYVFAAPVPASGNVFRVTARARWREDVENSVGERIARISFSNSVNASYDFLQADPATELTSSGADIVTTEACESCHGDRIGNVGHGGGYTEVKTCNTCHNINYMLSRNGGEGDLAFMIHTIHSAGIFDEITDSQGNPEDFSELTYPQEIHTCSKCHTADAANADLSELVPTRANCGSCHADINFATGDGHDGGQQDNDASCALCHRTGFSIGGVDLDPAVVHIPDPLPENVPEYDVTITMTPPANGTHYVAGEAPEVTVTLSPTGGTPAVDYDANQDPVGDTDGVLHEAELFIYGPRANAVPVLTTNSTTDPAWIALPEPKSPTQGHNLLVADEAAVPNPDALVTTDATGFKYQLLPIPADFPAGTYMVRFEGLDIGVNDANDNNQIEPALGEYYQTASTALINFQVGQADEEAKVSGDACTNCHGDTVIHLGGAHPHNVPFDTDQCLGCHDLSENYGNYIGNRVHAVHSASATGDAHPQTFGGPPRNWSEVTYPRPPNNCRTCHTNSAADVPVWRDPNEVACGGCHGTQPIADPADYPDVDAEDLAKEVAAAVHMREMGGILPPDATTTNPDDPAYVPRQCIVCHGEDRIADTFVTHGLINFPAGDDDL